MYRLKFSFLKKETQKRSFITVSKNRTHHVFLLSASTIMSSANYSVCVVTGGSRGIGLAIVHALLHDHPEVIVYSLDIKAPEDDISKHAITIGMLTHLHTDISDCKAFTSRLDEVFRFRQRLDCLVNNAGVFETSENKNVLWDPNTTMDQINVLMTTNFASVVHGTRTAVHLMKPLGNSRKTIINIASTAAFGPFAMHPVYCSCKAAVMQFTQTAQLDLKSHGFRVYAVCPGIIDTDMGRMGGASNQHAVKQLKGGQRTKPELVAEAVVGLFLQQNPAWNECSHLIVDNHEIQVRRHTVPRTSSTERDEIT
jgi:NAD(P)-dependent dehydrogenase (short-subunit alcohol dehydrogenase family)